MSATSTEDVARRCLEDPDYAKGVLESGEHPEITAALYEDLASEEEVAGFLNPQPLPPGPDPDRGMFLLRQWALITPLWSSMRFVQLRRISG